MNDINLYEHQLRCLHDMNYIRNYNRRKRIEWTCCGVGGFILGIIGGVMI